MAFWGAIAYAIGIVGTAVAVVLAVTLAVWGIWGLVN